jgi:F420-dependent oxidoreductase-like protein
MAQLFDGQLRFGVHAGPQHATAGQVRELWRVAEAVGLDWVSVFDHFQPIGDADRDGPCFEGFATLAAMAASTERVRCGIVVTGVTYRHPALVAKMAATIDHFSGGRMELGMGAAWNADEHREYQMPFPPVPERMDRLDEALAVIRLLFEAERPSFSGRYYSLEAARANPRPLQERLPIWVGGAGERRTLPIVARRADGWNTFFGPLETYRRKLDVLAGYCQEIGRDPAQIRKALVVHAVLGRSAAEAEARLAERAARLGVSVEALRRSTEVVGEPAQLVEALAPMVRLGVGDFLLQWRPPVDEEALALFADEVAPALGALASDGGLAG